MKGYTCDQCGKQHNGRAPVKLKGVARKSGILLPSNQWHLTFCQPLCFWEWVGEQAPDVSRMQRS